MALVFVLSILFNLTVSALCIMVYFKNAFREAEAAVVSQQHLEELRDLLRDQSSLLTQPMPATNRRRLYRQLEEQVRPLLPRTATALEQIDRPELAHRITEAHARKVAAVNTMFDEARTGAGDRSRREATESFLAMDALLSEAVAWLGDQRRAHIAKAAHVQRLVVVILVTTTAIGGMLCVAGLWVVRRWVVLPTAQLRAAAGQIARGDFHVQLDMPTDDELGQLGDEIDQMADDLAAMQEQLVARERRVAAGEMVSHLHANMSKPLSEIRVLAEASGEHPAHDPEVLAGQKQIVETVDRFQNWLLELQMSLSPTTPDLRPVSVRTLLDDVRTVLQPTIGRSGVHLETAIDPTLDRVDLDKLQFEQAVFALAANAIEASSRQQTVRLIASPVDDHSHEWELRVEDQGQGIPAELVEKIFLPFFTTKTDGNGIGLTMVSAVVQLHGGKLTVDSNPDKGTAFRIVIPVHPRATGAALGNPADQGQT